MNRRPPTHRAMKRGTKLSVYGSCEVDPDLALRTVVPRPRDPALLRRVLASHVDTAEGRQFERKANGAVWN
jgi:hypothetical protein